MSSYARDENIVTRSVAGEMVLVPVRQNVGDLDSVFTVSEVGREIWNLLERPRSLEELVEAITSEFEVERELAEKDVAEFLAGLDEAGLIRKQD